MKIISIIGARPQFIKCAPHGEQTGKMLIEIEKIIIKEQPDLVLTYGDTNSTLAGALEYNITIAEEQSEILSDLDLISGEFILATLHRPANTDSKEKLLSILKAFYKVDEIIVFPVHPRTEKYLQDYGLWDKLCEYVKAIQPVGYTDMLKLMSHAKKILTDSGGIQKEAYMLGVPCITMRENTEWVETIEEGWNVLMNEMMCLGEGMRVR